MGKRISVDGDAKSGWIVGVHDGDTHKAFSPEGDTEAEAVTAAMKQFDDENSPRDEARNTSAGRRSSRKSEAEGK